jgi:hypothetical protein
LIAYQDKHGLRTIRQIVSRWAPPTENNTNAYVRAVAADTGWMPTSRSTCTASIICCR